MNRGTAAARDVEIQRRWIAAPPRPGTRKFRGGGVPPRPGTRVGSRRRRFPGRRGSSIGSPQVEAAEALTFWAQCANAAFPPASEASPAARSVAASLVRAARRGGPCVDRADARAAHACVEACAPFAARRRRGGSMLWGRLRRGARPPSRRRRRGSGGSSLDPSRWPRIHRGENRKNAQVADVDVVRGLLEASPPGIGLGEMARAVTVEAQRVHASRTERRAAWRPVAAWRAVQARCDDPPTFDESAECALRMWAALNDDPFHQSTHKSLEARTLACELAFLLSRLFTPADARGPADHVACLGREVATLLQRATLWAAEDVRVVLGLIAAAGAHPKASGDPSGPSRGAFEMRRDAADAARIRPRGTDGFASRSTRLSNVRRRDGPRREPKLARPCGLGL